MSVIEDPAPPTSAANGAASLPPTSAPLTLAGRLSLLPKEQRSGKAITDADIAAAAALDPAAFTDLCEELRGVGVRVEPFRKRVEATRPKAPKEKRAPHLRLVDPNDGQSEGGDKPRDDRPMIAVDAARVHDAVISGVRAVGALPNIYQRDGAIVHVIGSPEPSEDDRAPIAADTPSIRPLQSSALWERASEAARWLKWDGRAGGYVPCPPPKDVVNAMSSREIYPGVRPLVGILESPSLRPDGTVILDSGYDEATGFLCIPRENFRPPPARPSPADAKMALEDLAEVFCDFPYRDDAARMVPIAAVFTVIARPAILGAVPGFVFDASVRGSGKTLQANAVSLLATGHVVAPMSYPGDDVELEKILGSYALRGPQLINFDNVTTAFGGGPLDRVLTAEDKVPMRVLGRSEVPELSWRSVILTTGTNIALRGDAARRLLVSRLETNMENPEERSGFVHPNLLEWIRSNRVQLVYAALTVLRAYFVAGCPAMASRSTIGGECSGALCKSWGGFDAWARLIPQAILFAGGADPMLARPVATGEEEPEKAALIAIIAHMPRLDAAGKGLSARDIVTLLYPGGKQPSGERPPDGYDDLREAIEQLVPPRGGAPPDVTRLGAQLGKLRGRPVGGMRLSYVTIHGVRRWRVDPVQ